MIASLQSPLVKHLVRLREERSYREECGSVLVTGRKLVRELAQKYRPKKLFVLAGEEECSAEQVYQVTDAVLKKITALPSPEPIAAEFPLPSQSPLTGTFPLLVLDAIRDPGNLGTLMRTALALGWGGIFFLPTCVDPFHEKVLRSSRGAAFYLPYRSGTWGELEALKDEAGAQAYVADMEGTPLSSIKPSGNIMLLLSNEAQGVHERSKNFGSKVAIPMPGSMESLNVAIAGAILMYQLGNG